MLCPARVPSKILIDRQTYHASTDDLYAECAPEVALAMAKYKSGYRKVDTGCDLFSLGEQHDVIYALAEGWVALYKLLEDGRRQILHFALPGAVLGFVTGQVMTYSAQALTPVVVCVIPRRNLYSVFRNHPEIGMQLAWLVSRDRNLAYDHLSSIGRQSARERVAHLLLELFIRYRMQWPGHRIEEMHLPLTQEHVGDATGLTGVHVNRVLRDLGKDGIVKFHYKRLQILNPDKLIDVAGIDPHVALSWIKEAPSNNATAGHHQAAKNISITAHLEAGRRRAVQLRSRMVASSKTKTLEARAR